ncbi:MAG TPA: RES family NAD+ phosphorylase [Candidatus Acidoferrum sp.]|nr:RES family NAD+ phosphorylase [Candidatus Acidoferrum sp.]
MAGDRLLPRVSDVLRDDTHRLIPARYSDRDESVLTRLSDDAEDLNALFELEGATNDRLLGEAGLLPGITVRELVFGLSYSHIVNAAFTHASPLGSRFNGPERGAWYAAFTRKTSELEVAYHKSKELQEINWQENETFTYVDFLADFRGTFHDMRNDTHFKNCLDANSYSASQHLANELLERGSAGVVYPSVRHKVGTCIVCFRPALVNNVRKGSSISIGFENAFATPEIREIK